MSVKQLLTETTTAVVTAPGHRLDQLFTLLQILFVGTLLVLTRQYNPNTQLFPMIVGTVTLVMLLTLLLMQFSDRVRNLLTLDEADALDNQSVDKETRIERRHNLLMMVVWTFVLVALILLIGFIPGIFLFLLGFYRLQAEVSWRHLPLYVGSIWLFTYLVFEVVLRTRFYEGLLRGVFPF